MGVDYGNILKTFESASEHPSFPTHYKPTLDSGMFSVLPLDACSGCPQITSHQSWGRGEIWPSGPWTNPIKAEQRIDVRELRKYQLMIKLLNFVANGILGLGWIYNTVNGSNYVTVWSFPIISAGGNQLVLDATAQRPDNLPLYSYKYWDENEWCWKWITVHGALQPLDMVMFGGDSILTSRVGALVVDMDFSDLDKDLTFTVTLNQTCNNAMTPADPTKPNPSFDALFYRHCAIPEKWEEIHNADLLECTVKQIVELQSGWPPDKIFTLLNTADYDCRIAIPNAGDGTGFGQTFMVKKWVSGVWVDITETVINQGRVAISQPKPPPYRTKVYLGTQLPGGGTGSDLLSDATAVKIWYMPEVSAGKGDPVVIRPCIGRCQWSREEYNGVLGTAYGSRSFFCQKKFQNPSGLLNYLPMCFQYNTCNMFQPLEPYTLNPETFDALRCAFDTYVQQIMPGMSYYWNFYLDRGQHPSIGYLLGLIQMVSEQQMWPTRTWYGCNAYGVWDGGAKEFKTGAFQIGPNLADLENPASWPTKGVLPNITDWQYQKDGYHNQQLDNENDTYYEKRYTFARGQIGYQRDEGNLAGRGERYVQRFLGKETVYLPDVEDGVNKVCAEGQVEFGSWEKPQGGTIYQRRVKINRRGRAGTETKCSGTVHSAVVAGTEGDKNIIGIQCDLGSHQGAVGPVMGEDRLVQWQGGGNIVEPPSYAHVRSYYEYDKVIGYPTRKAWPGDTIVLSGTNIVEIDDIPFFIIKGRPHLGDRLGFGNKVKRRRFLAGGYFSVAEYHGWGPDEQHTVDEVKVRNDTDSNGGEVWMTQLTGPDRPMLSDNEFWFDEFIAAFVFSRDNCKIPTRNGDTITIYWKKDGEPNWQSVQKSDATVPTGYIEHSFQDNDFDINSPGLEVRGGQRKWDNNLYGPGQGGFYYEWTNYTKITNGDPLIYEYYYYKTGTYPDEVHHFRFSYYNSGDIIEIKYTKEEATNLDGVVGLPPNYQGSWGDKADCLWVLDENGVLSNNLGALEGASFDITSQGILHPTKDTGNGKSVRLYMTDYQTDSWQEIQASDMWIDYALGYIYFDPVT